MENQTTVSAHKHDATSRESATRDTTWEAEYPKLTKLFRTYIVNQDEDVWEREVVRPYRLHGEKRLEFKGLAQELETLADDQDSCANYLADVCGIESTPTDAYLIICQTYNELVVDDSPTSQAVHRRKGLRVRNAPNWAPDTEADNDADGTINSKQLWELQLNARVPALPGRWGQIPISQYALVAFLALVLGIAISTLLPYPVIGEIGKVLIVIGFSGSFICALLLTTFRSWVEHGDDEEPDENSPAPKPNRFKRILNRTRGK